MSIRPQIEDPQGVQDAKALKVLRSLKSVVDEITGRSPNQSRIQPLSNDANLYGVIDVVNSLVSLLTGVPKPQPASKASASLADTAIHLSGTADSLTAGNAKHLLGATWDAPPAIGGTTPAAGTFTTTKAMTGAAVGGATPGTGGVAFPATQVAVADANTLDDYEEGTWAPNQGGGLTVVGAFSSSGLYTKIGRKVTVTGRVSGATSVAVTAAGVISSNAPFTSNAGPSVGMGQATNAAVTVSVAIVVAASSADIYAAEAITATTDIYFSATYFV